MTTTDLPGQVFIDQMNLCDALIGDERRSLRRTWWPPTRRRIHRRIADLKLRRREAMDSFFAVVSGTSPQRRGVWTSTFAPYEHQRSERGRRGFGVSEEATEAAPIYTARRQDDGYATARYMIVCDEGWRQSIVCENMYGWAAEWLVNTLGRKPYAPNNPS
jgi:hypothetical protein